jgi:uncharacterized protein YjbI with pentapeptide repeats
MILQINSKLPMTDSNILQKKEKITFIASKQGLQIAKNSLKRMGFESKLNFSESTLISRSVVTKFFQCQPIQLDSFKKICKELKLDWQKIVLIKTTDIGDTEEVNHVVKNGEGVSTTSISVVDPESKEQIILISLTGDFHRDLENTIFKQSLDIILQKYAGKNIEIISVQKGSIRLIIKGFSAEIKKIVSGFEAGKIKDLKGLPIEKIEVFSNDSETYDKWHLIQKIKSQKAVYKDLSDMDLSDTNLSDIDLSNTNLSNTDLSNTDLSGADLSEANLSNANLSRADLSRANLSEANLSNANLNNADLIDANLSNADLHEADLSEVNLSNANLSNAYLVNTYLIRTHLSDANLSGVNLSKAYLSDATLCRVKLTKANLTKTNLIGAYLIRADISDADMSDADMSGANLSGANLSGTNLTNVRVSATRFGNNIGISNSLKYELDNKGAIFEDSPGDRSRIYVLKK